MVDVPDDKSRSEPQSAQKHSDPTTFMASNRAKEIGKKISTKDFSGFEPQQKLKSCDACAGRRVPNYDACT